jgi:hypothetical protein
VLRLPHYCALFGDRSQATWSRARHHPRSSAFPWLGSIVLQHSARLDLKSKVEIDLWARVIRAAHIKAEWADLGRGLLAHRTHGAKAIYGRRGCHVGDFPEYQFWTPTGASAAKAARPVSVILKRTMSIVLPPALTVWRCAVANPVLTRLESILRANAYVRSSDSEMPR